MPLPRSSSSDDGAMKTSTASGISRLIDRRALHVGAHVDVAAAGELVDHLLPRHAGAVAVDDGVLEQARRSSIRPVELASVTKK